jgi:hypothetical protein
MKRLLREPLLHFVLLGGLLFVIDASLRGRSVEAGGGDIVVSQGRIENLVGLFVKTRHRAPTADELRGLVDDYILEEALYREGLALGVDRGDTIIRRRVRQKMEFVMDDVVELAEPTEAELEVWFEGNAQSYARPANYTFRQVFLSPERRGATVRDDAERLLAELRSTAASSDPREYGDRSLLEHVYSDFGADLVARSFGQPFADHLAELPKGQWSGPVESSFGLHIVLIDESTEEELPTLAEVRAAVERDWSYAQRQEATKRFYEEVVGRYRVSIEWPQGDSSVGVAESNSEPER